MFEKSTFFNVLSSYLRYASKKQPFHLNCDLFDYSILSNLLPFSIILCSFIYGVCTLLDNQYALVIQLEYWFEYQYEQFEIKSTEYS